MNRNKLWSVGLVTVVGLCVGVERIARAEQPDAASGVLSYEALTGQVEIAQALRSLNLSQEQITQLQKITAPLAESRRKLDRFRARDDVRAALRKVRDAVLSGTGDDAIWVAFEPFQEESNQLETANNEAAAQATDGAVALLTPPQLARLLLSQVTSPAELMEQLAQNRAAEPDAWRDWRASTCKSLAGQVAGAGDQEPPADMVKTFAQFFDRVRNMPTDDFFAKRDVLTRELRALLIEAIGQNLSEERRDAAKSTLQSWLISEGFAETLQRLASLAR